MIRKFGFVSPQTSNLIAKGTFPGYYDLVNAEKYKDRFDPARSTSQYRHPEAVLRPEVNSRNVSTLPYYSSGKSIVQAAARRVSDQVRDCTEQSWPYFTRSRLEPKLGGTNMF